MRYRNYAMVFCLLCAGRLAVGQNVAQVPGGGSYADSVPAANLGDGWAGPSVATTLGLYDTLNIDPAKKNGPIPTNRWWTNLLVSKNYDSNLWLYPGIARFTSGGLTLFYPNAWVPRNAATPFAPSGGFDTGPGISVDGVIPLHSQAGDTVLGDFSGAAYPAGWAATGDLAGTAPLPGGNWPGEGPPVTGFLGNACLNTFRGTNATQGAVTSPTFTINNHYINLLVGGGNDPVNTVVQLIINGSAVKSTTGADANGNPDVNLHWMQWDVSALKGQNAQIKIADTSGAGWGFILCSYIVATDNAADPATLYTTSFTAPVGKITNWGDWNLDYTQTDGQGNQIKTTIARGIPFVWARYSGLNPRIHVGAGTTLYDANGKMIDTTTGIFTASNFAFTLTEGNGDTHTFGIFAPANTVFKVAGDAIIAQSAPYLVYGFLPDKSNLAQFSQYAYARPTDTRMEWTYDRPNGEVATTWTIAAAPLQGTNTSTLQGFLPHHYRTTTNDLAFQSYSYLTPRGPMKIATGASFHIQWPFRGIAPTLPAPHVNGLPNDYNAARMTNYMNQFTAAGHPFVAGDTYYGARELAQSAQVMAIDAQLNQYAPLAAIETNLRAQMADWMTYTPGETNHYFARYNNWRALIGFNVNFGSQAFNDMHFHYGYFAVTAALLGMHDPSFLTQYGGMTRLMVKQYANWDRTDANFPVLRCFDLWEGHSGAGGLADGQGENQESSSEAMNSWAGMYLLGGMMNDTAMTDAGAMGYAIESTAVNEYWQDWKHTNFPASYGEATTGILASSGIAYGTYFSGDPVWVNAIQWVATNNWNNYLVRDKSVAANQLAAMWQTRADWDAHGVGGFKLDPNYPNNVEGIAQNGGAGLANAILGFQMMFDPDTVAATLDNDLAANISTATDATYSGESYYLTHSYRTIGDQDYNYYTSAPCSAVYFNARTNQRTFVIYNPQVTARVITVYNNGAIAGTITVPGRRLVATTALNSGAPAATPYFLAAAAIPGHINAVNFDSGGEGFGYHLLSGSVGQISFQRLATLPPAVFDRIVTAAPDPGAELDAVIIGSPAAPNPAGAYRPYESVRIESSSDGGYDVTGTAAGQWLQYGVQTPKAGTYTVYFRVAGSGAFHLQDETGANLTGSVTVPATGGGQKWTTLTATTNLAAGQHTLRLMEDVGGFNIESMTFIASGSAASAPVGQTISLKSLGDNLYVTAENGGNSPLIANRGGAAGWEQFVVTDAGSGNIALKAIANGKFVTVANGTLIASQTTIGPSETFQWFDQGNGVCSLKAANGSFVVAADKLTSLTASGNSLFSPFAQFLCATF